MTKHERRNATMRKYFKKTQGLSRTRKNWTKEEDVLILASPLNDYDLATIIQRSQHSIAVRRYNLRKENRFIVYGNTAYAAVKKELYGSNLTFVIK